MKKEKTVYVTTCILYSWGGIPVSTDSFFRVANSAILRCVPGPQTCDRLGLGLVSRVLLSFSICSLPRMRCSIGTKAEMSKGMQIFFLLVRFWRVTDHCCLLCKFPLPSASALGRARVVQKDFLAPGFFFVGSWLPPAPSPDASASGAQATLPGNSGLFVFLFSFCFVSSTKLC